MRITIGIVDYGVGNHASVRQSLHELGYRCRLTNDPQVLNTTQILVLPGVGAFPPAMSALHRQNLVPYLQNWARADRPIIGICLGMQLFSETSYEYGRTEGLGLIPGAVVPLKEPEWHIGWNTVDFIAPDPLFRASDGEAFYFNHSYIYEGPAEYTASLTRNGAAFASAVRKGRVVGVQFHPEKSQNAGRRILRNMIDGLCGA